MKKRLLSLALALVMALALLPTAAWAAGITVTEIVAPKYEDVKDFSEGLAAVSKDGKWGFIDKAGKEVIPCTYQSVHGFSEGLAVVRLDYKWGYIDTTGTEVIPCTLEYRVVDSFSEGLAAVSKNNKWGYIDTTGTEVIPCRYYSAGSFSEGLAAVRLDDKWGYIDTTGTEVIPCTLEYRVVDGFSEGLAEVNNKDFKSGFIDTTGTEVIPCRYYSAGSFSEGLAAVDVSYYGSALGFIDKTGQEVIPFKYDDAKDFSEGLAAVRNYDYDYGYTWGFIDKTGQEVIPFKYDDAKDFSEGLAAVKVDTGEQDKYGYTIYKWGYIDETGTEVIPCKYEKVNSFSEGLAWVELDGKWGLLAIDGYTGTPAPATNTAYASTQTVNVDGKAVTFECYALKDANGNATNYIKLRDLAMLLNGSAAQFQVGWDGSVTITTKTAYTPNGSELSTPYSGDRAYQETTATTKVNGQAADLAAFVLNDDAGGGYTYYQLRDLGKALGFNVGWAADKGIFVETNKPYNVNN